jgi:hypothetical protein
LCRERHHDKARKDRSDGSAFHFSDSVSAR